MNALARKKFNLEVIWATIRSLEASLVYKKNPADIEATNKLIASLQEEYAQLKLGAK
jgi:hypothetical protein